MNNFVFFFVIAICGTSSSLNIERTNRIIGGSPATDNQFRYMISLQQLSQVTNYTRGHRCGGALVSLRHALTSASCLYNSVNGVHTLIAANDYRVFAGAAVLTNDSSVDRLRTIANVTVHPNYSPGTPYVNDIAVITLNTEFPSNAVSTVPLSNIDATPLQGAICTSSGWGSQNNTNSPSTQLMYLQKTVLEQAVCQTYFTGAGTTLSLQDTQICALATTLSSSCSGDSGNPLVCNGNLNGILVINGHNCLTSADLRPEVYTRVSRFATWINSTIEQTTPTTTTTTTTTTTSPTTTTTTTTTSTTTTSPVTATTPAPGAASTFQPGLAVLAVIAIFRIITPNVFN